MNMKLEDNLMIQFLKKFDENPFLIKINGKEVLVGEGKPAFVVRFNKSLDIKELRRSTSLALGEAYMRGDIEVEGDLFQALDQLLGQMGKFSLDKTALKKLIFTSNSKKNQKDEVSSHYDIDNDFYRLWLDDTLSYSCGYFKNPDDTLYDAQVNKVDYILEKLYLKEGMSLLDIGCGWGFLLIEAAKKYGINGVGITLSLEQHKKFSERIAEEGLEGQLTAELMDYRDLPKYGKTFDRIVSVGMVEHVGRDNYDLFLSCADKVLNPKGLFLLHYISALEEHPGDPWIKKYIFPGGMIPSLREMISLAASHRFYVIDVESLRRHYTKTLLCWDKGFREHLDEVREMFDDEFIRMWDLYLCSCAATFHNGIIDLSQILMTKGVNNDLPMTRWY
ncbi:cyclopropane-fatty-acyl-phospholipid synthase family protein [Eubacterium callanderi]|nr:cyclopropane-fatty-acyl-phospholipid synthase family protein [Eubacterium callanderi]MCB6660865.1 cyclopropane-fatty-acyl-phospholipid synthase family protein [Eubacterium callanderi]MCB6753831.1 cyclopropane-fatty-acyl-phospholipid synthase family protein [Eubacterium callanderi]MCB7105712.1 cyclopropane-fatty-acyl-phospholipid synthase family protein [Eubacterium callanderi]MCG4821060.1 cyclopropane-fatty-acyl-phospholipid synthase family protein [Eubacterium callanderi]MCQ5190834.1 cyclo